MNKNQFGVYVHIPFCVKKCNYCDFLSFAADDDTKKMYIDALIREINASKPDERSVASIFFGGGTPSVLNTGMIASVMEAIYAKFNVADDAEITIECNPETLSLELAREYISSGINRISFGLQSTDDNVLKILGRIHTYEKFVDSFNLARTCGFLNINVDMMAALPGQTIEGYLEGLRRVAMLEPEHISAYSLIVEEGTHIYENISDYPQLPDEDTEREMYHKTEELLSEFGFKRYEISNFAKQGFRSRHNLSYWELTEYLGVGLGASGFYKGFRYTNTSDMKTYLSMAGQPKAFRDFHEETREDLLEEFMFLGLRKTEGISYDEFREIFGCDIKNIYLNEINKNIKIGLLEEYKLPSGGQYLRLTPHGTDLSNIVMSEFVKTPSGEQEN